MAKRDLYDFTSDEFRVAIDLLGMTQSGAGTWAGCARNSGRRWAMEGCTGAAAKLFRLALLLQNQGWTPSKVDQLLFQHERMLEATNQSLSQVAEQYKAYARDKAHEYA